MRIRHWIAWGLLVLVVLGIGGTAWALSAAGYQKFVVKTGSMAPTIKPGDLVIDRPVSGAFAVGDVITFPDSQAELVTHRIVEITPDGIKTKGDANETADVWTIPQASVVGVVAFVIPKGGYVVLFLSQPAGIAAVLIAVAALVLLWRLFFPAEPVSGGDDGRAPGDGTVRLAAAGRHAAPDSSNRGVAGCGTTEATGVGHADFDSPASNDQGQSATSTASETAH